jgi:outer membrane protein assembly factor BamA
MKFSSIILLSCVVLLAGCSLTKKVPEGEYLLKKVVVNHDAKGISNAIVKNYLRQEPNARILGTMPMLALYNLAGADSSKWINRALMRMGDAPVVYSENLTRSSEQQIKFFFQNKGYINAEVTTNVKFNKRNAVVSYSIVANKPLKLNNYSIAIPNERLIAIGSDSTRSLVRRNMLFDADVMNDERERITRQMRQEGFYFMNRDVLVYKADSTLGNNKIDAELHLREIANIGTDSLTSILFVKYDIRNITYIASTEGFLGSNTDITTERDTTVFRNYKLIGPKDAYITLDALIQNTFIESGTRYTDRALERTYAALNSLGPIKYVDISFMPVINNQLDCIITIVPAKTVNISGELEGTYTGGFWGWGVSAGIVNRNLFNGAEELSTKVKLASEWQLGNWAQERTAQVGLQFPKFIFPFGSYDFKRNIHAKTDFQSNIAYQYRPQEFTVFNTGGLLRYSWEKQRITHALDFFNLSYVYFSNLDQSFINKYLSTGLYNSYNYQNHLILRAAYNGTFTTFNPNRPLRNFSTFSYGIETAGNMMYGINRLLKSEKGTDDTYRIFNNRYAQYVRSELNSTFHQIFDKNNRLVFHAGIGLGLPYANSDQMPFERRFYSGGASSVRGWRESFLGPGTYKRNSTVVSRDYNQVGDVKIDLNLEFRSKLFWVVEGGFFLDAGNVWTISDYETQPGGAFKWNSFINEFALSYGAGLRLDFSFFILRIDAGLKLRDPALAPNEQWRMKPNWNDDTAFHIAIGYPF